MFRGRYRFVIAFGTAASLVETSRQLRKIEEENGWAISRLWNPSFGILNEFFFEADYPDEESFRRERDARHADERSAALWREIYPHVVPGSFLIELLDELDLAS